MFKLVLTAIGCVLAINCMAQFTVSGFVRDGKTEKGAGFHRVYACSELHRLLRESGLADIETYGSLDFEPFKLGSPRLLVVARK